mgnify:CR=1 FL=1
MTIGISEHFVFAYPMICLTTGYFLVSDQLHCLSSMAAVRGLQDAGYHVGKALLDHHPRLPCRRQRAYIPCCYNPAIPRGRSSEVVEMAETLMVLFQCFLGSMSVKFDQFVMGGVL